MFEPYFIVDEKVDWSELSKNPSATEILRKTCLKTNLRRYEEYEELDFWRMTTNRKVISEFRIISKIDWSCLSLNPDSSAIQLLKENFYDINWENLSENPSAMELLEANPKKINWGNLSKNPSAIKLLEKNRKKIDWSSLSENPSAIKLLEENFEKIDWIALSRNPSAIKLLEENPDKIDWLELSTNPNAIHLLSKNLHKVNWENLSKNPNALHLLIKPNYIKMKNNAEESRKELIEKVFDPTRCKKICKTYNISLIDYLNSLKVED